MPLGIAVACAASDGLDDLRGNPAERVHAGTPVTLDLWGRAVAATAWD